jgi:hypothetical protein
MHLLRPDERAWLASRPERCHRCPHLLVLHVRPEPWTDGWGYTCVICPVPCTLTGGEYDWAETHQPPATPRHQDGAPCR